jgi:FMN-dependent NADH-azoreductase
MNNIIHIDSSITGENSVSRQLTAQVVKHINQTHSATTYIDLAQQTLPTLDGFTIGSFFTPEEHRTAEQQAIATLSDQLIAQLKAADILVIGAPMYNFTIPTQLKTYFDLVARAGLTFQYTETGPKGLLENKTAYVVVSSGGNYKDQANDFVTPYVKLMLGFMGITDVHVITAAGTAGDKDAALTSAQEAIVAL